MPKTRERRRAQKPILKKCYFCENKLEPSFSETTDLGRFLTERGKIISRMRSGLCAKHQRRLAKAVKRARHLALLSFVVRT